MLVMYTTPIKKPLPLPANAPEDVGAEDDSDSEQEVEICFPDPNIVESDAEE